MKLIIWLIAFGLDSVAAFAFAITATHFAHGQTGWWPCFVGIQGVGLVGASYEATRSTRSNP